MSISSLFVSPRSPTWINNDINVTVKTLRSIGLIASPIANKTDCYFAGEKFLSHILFMGCSPAIEFKPSENSAHYTYIKLHHSDTMQFIHGKNTRAPHCPACKKSMPNWQPRNNSEIWTCEHCQNKSALADYDWRRNAGFAHFCIEITEIYPREAVPQLELLSTLQQTHNTDWDYFYIQFE